MNLNLNEYEKPCPSLSSFIRILPTCLDSKQLTSPCGPDVVPPVSATATWLVACRERVEAMGTGDPTERWDPKGKGCTQKSGHWVYTGFSWNLFFVSWCPKPINCKGKQRHCSDFQLFAMKKNTNRPQTFRSLSISQREMVHHVAES